MADFDPDAYLGSAPSGGGGFDPDAYLGKQATPKPAVESEGMSDVLTAGVRAAKAAASHFFQPSEVEKTGNIPVDLLKGGAEAALSRPLESVQAGVAAGTESFGEKVDPLLGKIGMRPMKQLGRDIAGMAESEGVGGGRGMGDVATHAPSAAPRETARVLQKIAQEASGEPRPTPGGIPTEGPPAAPTFPPATGPEPPQPTPAPLPAGGRRSVGAAGGADALGAASPEAQEMVQRAFEPSGYTRHSIEDTIEGLHPEETLGEANEDLRGHMGGLQSLPGQQRIDIADTLRGRHAGYPERATGYLDDAFGQGVNVREWEADIKRQRKAAADPLWERFENTRITPTPEIEAILPRLQAAGALTEANRFLAMEGKPATRGFPELTEEVGGGNSRRTPTEQEHVPTAEAFQYAKEALDDDITNSKKPGARRRLMGIKSDLINAIDNHPDPEVAGVWKSARDVWAGPTGVLKAKDFGRKVLSDAVSPEEFTSLWGEMSPGNREGVRVGLRDMLGDLEGKKGTAGRRMANLESVINSPDNQLKIRAMLGDERAEQLFRSFEHEQRMRQSMPNIIGNSQTSPRESYKAFWSPPEVGPLEKAAKVAGTVADVATLRVGSLAKKGLEYVGNRMDARAADRSRRINEEAGRIFSTTGAERDAILRELTRRTEEGPGGLNGPVGRQPLTPQVLERGRSGRPIKRTPLPIGTENEILERGARKVEEGPAPGEQQPPERQGMSFGDMKRRDFLKGIAATGIAAAKPEVITSALKRVGMGERLVDAAAPRALARQAIYSFGEDKAKALDYLYENAKNAKPGGPIEKAYRAAVRHITSGDIDKEPSIWAKSVAELRKHDDTIRAAQTARRAAEQLPGRGEVPETAGPKLEAPKAAELPTSEEAESGQVTKATLDAALDRKPHDPRLTADVDAATGNLFVSGLPTARGGMLGNALFNAKTGELVKTGDHWITTPSADGIDLAQEITHGLIREHGSALATAGEPIYARYGDIPKGGRSKNFQTGKLEPGVSVYEMNRNLIGGHLEHPPEFDFSVIKDPKGNLRPLYEVTGKVVGRGSDGEPLLSNTKIVREIPQSEVEPKDPGRLLAGQLPLARNVTERGRSGRPSGHERQERASGGAVKAPLSARKKYSYAHDRGTEKEHCSNCSMFQAPHGCSAVGGFIAKMGKCDIWEAARKRRAEGGSVDDSDLEDIPTRSERFLADIDRSRYADGGSLFDPTPMANNPPYSLSQDFHERLPDAEGQIEDRRGENRAWDHMMSNLRNVRRATGNMAIGFDYRLPRATGKLAEGLGVHDIDYLRHRDMGGGGK